MSAKEKPLPKKIEIEYNIDGVLNNSRDSTNIVSLKFDGKIIDYADYTEYFNGPKPPFYLGDFELLETTALGIREVRITKGRYEVSKGPNVRLDNLGERGGNHRIFSLELTLKEK